MLCIRIYVCMYVQGRWKHFCIAPAEKESVGEAGGCHHVRSARKFFDLFATVRKHCRYNFMHRQLVFNTPTSIT